jgi:hypothetical protein
MTQSFFSQNFLQIPMNLSSTFTRALCVLAATSFVFSFPIPHLPFVATSLVSTASTLGQPVATTLLRKRSPAESSLELTSLPSHFSSLTVDTGGDEVDSQIVENKDIDIEANVHTNGEASDVAEDGAAVFTNDNESREEEDQNDIECLACILCVVC